MSQPTILTIAGSDCSGGAGIQADLKAIQALGGYGTSVITAVTAQNTLGVQGLFELEVDAVTKQLKSLFDDVPPVSMKTGMLASTEIINCIVDSLEQQFSTSQSSSSREGIIQLPPLVIDPVLTSTSMHTLTPSSALHAIITKLLPLGILVTPNVGEAQALHAGIRKIESVDGPEQEIEIKNIKDMVFAAEAILDYISSRNKNSENSRGVLLKGGHLPLEAANLSSALRDIKNLPDYVEVVWGADSLGLGTELEPENDACFEVLRQYRSEQATKAVSDTSLQIVVPTASTSDGVQPPPALTGKKYIVDVLVTYQPGETSCKTVLFVSEAIDSRSTHGTGCTLSAAIATKIGHGQTLRKAVEESIAYVRYALVTAVPKGEGWGPLNHQCYTVQRTIPLPTSSNPHPFVTHLLRETQTEWRGYVRHPFVVKLGQGTLPRECFKHYIIQDWHYLKHYARAHSLAASKTTDFEEIKAFSGIALHIARESAMHVEFCASFGISLQDLIRSTESPSNFAYSQYILDVGHRGDNLELVVAVFSCLIGYGEVGLYLNKKIRQGEHGFKLEGNPYKRWIEDYSGKDFRAAVSRGIETLEERIVQEQPSPTRMERLVKIWRDCVQLETNFWQMGLDMS